MQLVSFCGWAYAIVWGFAFYPTLYLNYTLKTADSISLDYVALNIVGYICYSISILLQLKNDIVRNQYMQVFNGNLPLLSNADLFYSFHGIILLLTLLSQIIFGNLLWNFHNERINFKIHRLTRTILFILALFTLTNWLIDDPNLTFLNLAINLAYVKIIISLIKYIPQVIRNYRRKSMYGISKLQIMLDLLGAFFSFMEFYLKKELPLIDALNANRGKIGITIVTFLFACIFLGQVYIYGTEKQEKNKDKEDKDNKENNELV
jgi:cystinosin